MVTIGCDPEGFLVRDGKAVSSIGKIGGTKDFPLPVPGGALLEDNVLVEFNTTPVPLYGARDEFIKSIVSVQKHLKDVAELHNCEVVYTTEMEFDPEELEHPQARQSGCDPDYNIYQGTQNKYPDLHPTRRGAGGHIHLGIEGIQAHPSSLRVLLTLLDFKVGAVLKVLEGAKERDQTYGMYGNFRIKPYGIEYRTPSGFWLQSPVLMGLVYSLTQSAVQTFLATINAGKLDKYLEVTPSKNSLPPMIKRTKVEDKLIAIQQIPKINNSDYSCIAKAVTQLSEIKHVYT